MDTATKVRNFYHSPDVSKEMPSMKDYVSVREDEGCCERKQKFLMLCNLTKVYENFEEKYPALKNGFSKFAELQTKE